MFSRAAVYEKQIYKMTYLIILFFINSANITNKVVTPVKNGKFVN